MAGATWWTPAAQQVTRNVLNRFAGGALSPPGDVSATGGVQRVDLTWASSPGATSYNVYRSTSAGGEGSQPYRTGLTSTSFADTGLAAGTYYYQVAAVNGQGTSARSAEVSAIGHRVRHPRRRRRPRRPPRRRRHPRATRRSGTAPRATWAATW